MKRRRIALFVVLGFLALFAPVWPIQFKVEKQTADSGAVFYPVHQRKFPFRKWEVTYVNPPTPEDAWADASFQRHWFPLLAYDDIGNRWLPLDARPLPCASPAAPACSEWFYDFKALGSFVTGTRF